MSTGTFPHGRFTGEPMAPPIITHAPSTNTGKTTHWLRNAYFTAVGFTGIGITAFVGNEAIKQSRQSSPEDETLPVATVPAETPSGFVPPTKFPDHKQEYENLMPAIFLQKPEEVLKQEEAGQPVKPVASTPKKALKIAKNADVNPAVLKKVEEGNLDVLSTSTEEDGSIVTKYRTQTPVSVSGEQRIVYFEVEVTPTGEVTYAHMYKVEEPYDPMKQFEKIPADVRRRLVLKDYVKKMQIAAIRTDSYESTNYYDEIVNTYNTALDNSNGSLEQACNAMFQKFRLISRGHTEMQAVQTELERLLEGINRTY